MTVNWYFNVSNIISNFILKNERYYLFILKAFTRISFNLFPYLYSYQLELQFCILSVNWIQIQDVNLCKMLSNFKPSSLKPCSVLFGCLCLSSSMSSQTYVISLTALIVPFKVKMPWKIMTFLNIPPSNNHCLGASVGAASCSDGSYHSTLSPEVK